MLEHPSPPRRLCASEKAHEKEQDPDRGKGQRIRRRHAEDEVLEKTAESDCADEAEHRAREREYAAFALASATSASAASIASGTSRFSTAKSRWAA